MEKDFKKFDLQNKGFLNYNEYKALSYSHLLKPMDQKDIGDIIFEHDLKSIQKISKEYDYKEYFELYSENGYITFGSIKNLCDKINFDISDDEILGLLKHFRNKETQQMGYEEFLKVMEMIK